LERAQLLGLFLGSVVLPIGISFFTFEKLTYTIDVYRGVNKPLKSFWDFLLSINVVRSFNPFIYFRF
jgi:D-alanyl-lipoteichoic acid acyltransferase DltB (MBOAT superfamily)